MEKWESRLKVVKVEKLELACDAGGKESGKPWFVGKDVAEMLGYKKSRNALMAHVDGEDKKGRPKSGLPWRTLLAGSRIEAKSLGMTV